ncbi:MAG TPA: glycosyltransferase [Stellaceae bacterium]|nr:glycosyltransferase [Stellaceae bacterium]
MRLIFLSWAYPPIVQPRAVQVARLATALDRPIEIYCAGDASCEDGKRSIHRIAEPDTWGRIVPRAMRGIVAPPDPQRPWALQCAREIAARAPPGSSDLIVTFGQPMSSHLAGLALKRRFGNRWIAHFSDPWADNPMAVLPLLHRVANRRLERRVLGAADRVLFTSHETLDLVMSHHPESWRGKAGLLPHGFDETLYPPREKATGPIVLRYLGALYARRGPGPLLEGLELLARHDVALLQRLRVEFIGAVSRRFAGAEAKALAGTVRFCAPVDYANSLALMRSADLLLHIDAPAATSVFLASKLVDYLGSRRPIVGITPEGTAATLIRAMGGWVADPASPQAIASALAAAVAHVERRRDDDWGNDEVRQHYRIATVAVDFAAILDALAR